jgi:DNA adenine methylase
MSYPGSKSQAGVWQTIIGQMPPHTLYVEAFFGSGQIYWRKRGAARSVVIDKDPALLAKAGREPGTSAIAGDALKILPRLGLGPDALAYCDPPYLLSTRSGRRYYQHELSEPDHDRLLAVLQELPCRVMLSGYPSELYDRELRSWRCQLYRMRTRGKTVTEALWCNFPEPAVLHDPRYAGKTFRERLTFKRLAARYLARFSRMSERKRAFVLEAIEQRYFRRELPAPIVGSGAAVSEASESSIFLPVNIREEVNGAPISQARGQVLEF